MRRPTRVIRNKHGTAIIVALAFLSVLMIMTTLFVSNLVSSTNLQSSIEAGTKSFYIAEAGLSHALAKIDQLGDAYKGESRVAFGEGDFDVRVENHPIDADKKIIILRARLEGYPPGRSIETIRAVVKVRDSGESGSKVVVEFWEKMD